MSRTSKVDLPKHSLLHDYVQEGDFLDCYACPTDLSVDQAAARAMAFPFWARWLLRLRNILVAPLGLTNEFAEGDRIGPFPIDQRTDDEIILGLDDSHLNFRISILTTGTEAYCATWVHRNNTRPIRFFNLLEAGVALHTQHTIVSLLLRRRTLHFQGWLSLLPPPPKKGNPFRFYYVN